MSNTRYVLAAGLAVLGATHWAATAQAGDGPAQQPAPSALFDSKLNDEALDGSRGGTLVMNDMKLDGVVSDNHASNLVTGSNIVTGDTLAGANGMPTMIQNSGNNVLIQNATIVNVQLQ